ncbi:CBS domain-containing protein [Magnetococcales bacterium HHB-1]
MPIVRNCMIRNISTFNPSLTLIEAARRMVKPRDGLAVVIENMTPVGLLTDFDLLRWMARGHDFETTRLDEMRLSKPQTVYETTNCREFLEIFNNRRFRRFPVLNEEEMLSGGITEKQILSSLPRSNLLAHYRIADIPLAPPPTVTPNMSINKMIEKMINWHRGCVLVINKENKLLGMLTQGDVLRFRTSDKWSPKASIKKMMSIKLHTMSKEQNLLDAMDGFFETGYRQIPLVDENNILTGLLTQTDLLRELAHAARSKQTPLDPENISEPAVWFANEKNFPIQAINQKGAEILKVDPENCLGHSLTKFAREPKLWESLCTILHNSHSLNHLNLTLLDSHGHPLCLECRFSLATAPSGKESIFWTFSLRDFCAGHLH